MKIGDVRGADKVGKVAFVAIKDVEVRELEPTGLKKSGNLEELGIV